jgi:CRP-like cAMP-binding protein
MSEERCRILRNVALFSKLSEQQLSALAAHARRVYFLDGQRVFEQGSDGDCLYVVVRGRLKVTSFSSAGRESLLGLEGPGSVIGELSMLDGSPRSASVAALEDTELLVLGRSEVLGYLAQNAEAALSLVFILAARLKRLSRRTEDLASCSIPARLARRLLQLADDCGVAQQDGMKILVNLSQQELGEFIDATRESVNKHLKVWEARGVLSRDSHHIVIRSQSDLEEIARDD